jgi:glycine/D-amino acid oxidase-like deaminating enzyme
MRSDLLIVGGGIAGIAAAAHLAQLGSLTVLEAEDHLAYHASGRSAALYEPRYGPPAVVALSDASGEALNSIDGGVLTPRGLLLVAGPDRMTFDADRRALELDEISAVEARQMVPILSEHAVGHAAFASRAWDIDTDRLIQAYARTARKAGAQIVTGARVEDIHREGDVWVVSTPKGQYSARILVNAAGAWVDEIARMAGIRPLGFTPLRRSMARIPAPGGHDVSSWPMMFGAGESWYAKPDAGALIVSPAEEHQAEPHDAWADDMVLAEGLARYEAMVDAPVERLLASWAGLRTFSPDRSPVIGRDPSEPNFVWCAGQGGYGFQSAPAAAAFIADLIAGRQPGIGPDVVRALSVERHS